jgi:hypothetical protein
MGFKTLHVLSPDSSRGTKSQYTTETQKWRCSPFPQCFVVFGVLGSTVPNKFSLSFSLSHLKVEGFGRRMSTTCLLFYLCTGLGPCLSFCMSTCQHERFCLCVHIVCACVCVLAFACRGGRMRTAQGCHRRDGHPGSKKKNTWLRDVILTCVWRRGTSNMAVTSAGG